MTAYEIVFATMYLILLALGAITFDPLWIIAAVLLDSVYYLRSIAKKMEQCSAGQTVTHWMPMPKPPEEDGND